MNSKYFLLFAMTFGLSFAKILPESSLLEASGSSTELSKSGEPGHPSMRRTMPKRMNQDRVTYLKEELIHFTDDIMYFIGPVSFKYDDFIQNTTALGMRLLDLRLAIKYLPVPNALLSKKVDFTKIVFSELSTVVLNEKIFWENQVGEYEMLLRLMHMKLSSFCFCNEVGEPDSSLPVWFLRGTDVADTKEVYISWLNSLKDSFADLRSAFGEIASMREVIKYFVEEQVEEISRRIYELSAAVEGGRLKSSK